MIGGGNPNCTTCRGIRIDLSTGAVTPFEQDGSFYRRYMGGRNLIARLLLEEVPAAADPLGPDNLLIFA
ncbi:hypothetical protein JW905_13675, partial [bacterium]|nr:hypothetical protein [candidate division CSSED10-310 bacterium]